MSDVTYARRFALLPHICASSGDLIWLTDAYHCVMIDDDEVHRFWMTLQEYCTGVYSGEITNNEDIQ